ncbi:MAG: hypothetical protein Q4G65_07855 [bacterium]|nr:hypothetical protein [bacterium]
MRRWTAILVLVACASLGAVDVLTVPRDSFAWTVVHISPVELPVTRPAATARTVFTATNLAGEKTVQIEIPATEDVVVWTPFAGRAPEADEVYTLSLDYFQLGGTVPFSNETARVAVLRGAFGEAIDVAATAEAADWNAMGAQVVTTVDVAGCVPPGTPLTVRVEQEGTSSEMSFSGETGVFASRFRFPPWRVDRACTFSWTAGGTNEVSGPCRFGKKGYSVYAY